MSADLKYAEPCQVTTVDERILRLAAGFDPVLSIEVERIPDPVASGAHLETLPPKRRSPTRQVLKFIRKRVGSEIGAPPCLPGRGQCLKLRPGQRVFHAPA